MLELVLCRAMHSGLFAFDVEAKFYARALDLGNAMVKNLT